jgi:Domain of unknown function (DUF4136)
MSALPIRSVLRVAAPKGGITMRVKTLVAALALTAAAVTAGAATKSDFDKEYDWAKLKTFDFKPQARPAARDTQGPNGLWSRRIHDDLTADLARSGFQQTTSGNPDFLVAYYMGAKERIDVRTVGYGFPGWGRHRWAWGAWGPDFDVWNIPYTESTLVIDVVDAHTNMLVWRGYDTDEIDVGKSDKEIGKAVDALVKRFVKETRENG